MLTQIMALGFAALFVWRIVALERAVKTLTQELRDFQERQEYPIQDLDTENPKSGTMFK